jgi:GNAT superfamily N-acetyltransferase
MDKSEVTYASILDFPRGTFCSLVERCYAPIADNRLIEQWRLSDRETYDNPETVGACGIVACVADRPIGLASYDPRQFPKAIIGQNCVLPEYRGRGLGTQQMANLLRVLQGKGFKMASATTLSHPFFEPARRMYEACGFRETNRSLSQGNPGAQQIEYQADI